MRTRAGVLVAPWLALALVALLAPAAHALSAASLDGSSAAGRPASRAAPGDGAASGSEAAEGEALEGDPFADAPYADELYADEAAGDAYADELELAEPDPWEGFNRAVFGFNQRVDQVVVEPVARVYGWLVPGLAKRALLRVFANLNAPSILVNDLLQLECRRAGITLSRFVLNSTVGLVGIVDVADELGLEPHHSDFGQTLAVAGVPSGPYLVIPVAGPSTARDAVGSVVDLAFRPQTYFLGPAELIILGTSSGVATRESYIDELEALRSSSVDFYATMRNIYFQRRADQLAEVGVDMTTPAEVVETPLHGRAADEPPGEGAGEAAEEEVREDAGDAVGR